MSWVAAGATAATAVGNAFAQGNVNKKNRKFQREMWERTNEYNAPRNQMKRFKEAGLNPHLIYGQGNPGNATMINPPEHKAPDISGFADASMNYIAHRKQQTEIDNMEVARELAKEDILKRKADTNNVLANTEKLGIENSLLKTNFDTLVAQANANLSQTEATTQQTQVNTQKARQEIENLLATRNLTNAQRNNVVQSTIESAQRVKNLIVDNNIKQAESVFRQVVAEYARHGINFNQPASEQLLKSMANAMGMTPENIKIIGDDLQTKIKNLTWDIRNFFKFKR